MPHKEVQEVFLGAKVSDMKHSFISMPYIHAFRPTFTTLLMATAASTSPGLARHL